MDTFTIGGIDPDHHGSLLSLNNACAPHVNELSGADLCHLLGIAVLARAAWWDGALAGALIALGPGADYASANYRWFDERFREFIYVDRVVVDVAARGLGAGRRLYGEMIEKAPAGTRLVLCEVNLDPPNEASMAFHERLGFQAIGRLNHPDSGKTVALMSRPLAEGSTVA